MKKIYSKILKKLKPSYKTPSILMNNYRKFQNKKKNQIKRNQN